MNIEFSSQGREKLSFLTTNMAAVTSRANQQSVKVWTLPKFVSVHFNLGQVTLWFLSFTILVSLWEPKHSIVKTSAIYGKLL